MLCTLFGDNGKQGRQFHLRLEYSNEELQSAYRIERVSNRIERVSNRIELN